MKKGQRIFVVAMVMVVSAFGFTRSAIAQPNADQVLNDMGLSADDRQNVLGGQFVTADIKTVSERDLSIAIAFVLDTTPDALAKQIMAGELMKADTQIQANGTLTSSSTASDLASLPLSDDAASAFANASPGESLNLSNAEIAAFNALQGAGTPAVKQQLQKMLLARFQAYQASGLEGIAPYARDGGSSDPAGDLRRATDASAGLKKYMPAFQKVLAGYPQATAPGMSQTFRWLAYNMDGKPTYVLTHIMEVPDGDVRVVAQRQFYVSTGYNAEQAIIGFLPVSEGTLAVYTNHTFTDQVAGWGGSMKRSIGRSMMEKQLEKMFKNAQKMVQ